MLPKSWNHASSNRHLADVRHFLGSGNIIVTAGVQGGIRWFETRNGGILGAEYVQPAKPVSSLFRSALQILHVICCVEFEAF